MYDENLKELAELVKQSTKSAITTNESMRALAMTVDEMRSDVTEAKKSIKELGDGVAILDSSVERLNNRMTNIEQNEEITYAQQKYIRSAVNARVCHLLGMPANKHERTMEQSVEYKKYASLFHSRCYYEVCSMGHLRRPYGTTAKKDYDEAITDIESWFPRDGISGLKAEADKDAQAKKIAREQGYI